MVSSKMLQSILVATMFIGATSSADTTPLDGTCDDATCGFPSSLVQIQRRKLRVDLDGVFNSLANGFVGGAQSSAAPAETSALQVAGQADQASAESEASASASSTTNLLAQIKKQAEEAVTQRAALPDVARDLLANFSADVDNMIADLLETHNVSQVAINEAYEDLAECEDHWYNVTDRISAQNETAQHAEGEHAVCRDTAGENSSSWCSGLETILTRMHSDPLDCNVPNPRSAGECEAAPSIRPFIESVKSWAQDYLDEYTMQKHGCQEALRKDNHTAATCVTLQGLYEGEFCSLDSLVAVTIQSYEACRSTETTELEIVGIRNHTNEINRNEYVALDKIKCYLAVLLNYPEDQQMEAQKVQLEFCNSYVVDTSMFALEFPAEVPPLDFSSVVGQLSPKPGDEQWLSSYNPDWEITSAVSPCVVFE